LPDQSGFELHRQIHLLDACIPVVFVSNSGTPSVLIQAAKQGAFDYLFKPFQDGQLDRVLAGAWEVALSRELPFDNTISQTDETLDPLCGECPVMRDIYKGIGLVAGQDVNVLITGETGTGKELIAQAIYRHSNRPNAPFLALNCAAIPENLLESELFGHEKGAFSGAERRRVGKFEQCDGGTILLDEIGDMSLPLQAKILRLLQEQTFERVGGNETVHTNVRLIASTHRDLKTWSAEGKFRTDLYYRLGVFTIHLPPLRQRGPDIPILIRHFVLRYGREMGRDIRRISPEAMALLSRYSWPGNIRELQSVIRQALLRSYGQVLLPSFLPPLESSRPETPAAGAPQVSGFDLESFLHQRMGAASSDLYSELHRELDRQALARVLRYTRGNQRAGARLLGIARQTLRTKLRESGLYVDHSIDNDNAA
jgi:two-component system nitrogen regulation response regulator GlnG